MIVIISHTASKQISPADPPFTLILPFLSQFADECLPSLAILSHELPIRTDDHTLLTPRQHHVRPAFVRKKANFDSANHTDEDKVVFITLNKK
jgi:hypothetical protein